MWAPKCEMRAGQSKVRNVGSTGAAHRSTGYVPLGWPGADTSSAGVAGSAWEAAPAIGIGVGRDDSWLAGGGATSQCSAR